MIIKRSKPNVGELVLITVKKIMPFGAYCELQEYGVDSYLPVREIASGWIKNIHEFINEGQKDVAKVMFVDNAKNAIDISLKKVTEKEKKDKMSQFNLEKRYEGLFKQAMVEAKKEQEEGVIREELGKRYATFVDVVEDMTSKSGETAFSKISIDKKFKEAFTDIIGKNVKEKIYTVSYLLQLTSYDTKTGIESIKKVMLGIEKSGVEIFYFGAPNYSLTARGSSYIEAEEKIRKGVKVIEENSKSGLFLYSMKKEKTAA